MDATVLPTREASFAAATVERAHKKSPVVDPTGRSSVIGRQTSRDSGVFDDPKGLRLARGDEDLNVVKAALLDRTPLKLSETTEDRLAVHLNCGSRGDERLIGSDLEIAPRIWTIKRSLLDPLNRPSDRGSFAFK